MKRLLGVLLAILLLVAPMAGCAKAPASTEAAADTATAAATDTPASPAVKNEDITITVYAATAGYTAPIEQIVADYKAATGVTVDWEIPGEDYSTVLKTRFAADAAPDIFDLDGLAFAAWGERCADLSGCDFVSHAYPGSLDPATKGGAVLGMPYAFEGSGLIYNKTMFEAAGITEIPDTLDKLEAACVKLQNAGYQPFGEAWAEWGFLMHIFGTPFAYEGDTPELAAALASGEKKLADLKYMDNFFRLFDLTVKYGWGKESVGYSVLSQYGDFAQGKMAMIKQGTWLSSYILSVNPEIKMGLMAVPLTNDPTQTKLMTSTSRYFCINNQSKNVDACKAFLNWLFANMQTYFVNTLNTLAPYDTMDTTNAGVLNTDMFEYLKKNMAYPTFGTLYWPAGFEVDLATPLQSYIAGDMDQAAAIAALQKLYDSRLKTN